MTPTGAILAQVRSALAALASQPVIFETFAEVIAAESPRSLVIGPGQQETFEAETHTSGFIYGMRRFPVRVVCTAWTREEAETLRFEVEDALAAWATAAPYPADFLPASFTDQGGGQSGSERIYFSTVLDLAVFYQRSAP